MHLILLDIQHKKKYYKVVPTPAIEIMIILSIFVFRGGLKLGKSTAKILIANIEGIIIACNLF